MPNFSESLTIRILADSAPFQRELESLTRQLDDFESQLGSIGSLGSEIDRTAGRIGALQSPLSGVSRMLSQITGQIQGISRIPIILNIAPAVASLGGLSQMIDQVGTRMQLLSQLGSAGSLPIPSGFPVPRYAQGGLVTGSSGLDRVPAWLTSGEFVLRKSVVDRLGVSLLSELNQSGRMISRTERPHSPATSSQTVNHFGGINIHVRETGNVNAVVRDLRLQGIRLRNRRG